MAVAADLLVGVLAVAAIIAADSFRGSRVTRGGQRGGHRDHIGRDDILADASAQGGGQYSGGHGGAQGSQHVYVALTVFENAEELLVGLCYAYGSPDHRSGDAACPKGNVRRAKRGPSNKKGDFK